MNARKLVDSLLEMEQPTGDAVTEVVYHASDGAKWGQEGAFRPTGDAGLIHFGSFEAAWQRAKDKGIAGDDIEVVGYRLKGRFADVSDAGDWSHEHFWDQARRSGIWTETEFNALTDRLDKATDVALTTFWKDEFKRKGYDGIRYENIGEGLPGDYSYAVFDNAQIFCADGTVRHGLT